MKRTLVPPDNAIRLSWQGFVEPGCWRESGWAWASMGVVGCSMFYLLTESWVVRRRSAQ